MTESFKQQLQELIDQAADDIDQDAYPHESFKACGNFLMPVIESLIEIRNNYVNFRNLNERAHELIIQNDKELLNILKGEK